MPAATQVGKGGFSNRKSPFMVGTNQLLYLSLIHIFMPYFGIEKNFETTQEHLKSEREVMIDDLPNYIIMGNTEEDDVIE